jgi:hypothetical protein
MKIIGAAMLWLVALSAQAQLLGATVDVSARYPDLAHIYADAGVATVGADIEYPAGAFAGYSASWEIDITDNQLFITNTDFGFPFGEAEFNGFVLTVLSGPELLSAAVNPASGFAPIDVSVFGGNELRLNFSGVGASNDDGPLTAVIDIAFANAIPEPETYAMLIAGCALLGFVARRRRANAALAVS